MDSPWNLDIDRLDGGSTVGSETSSAEVEDFIAAAWCGEDFFSEHRWVDRLLKMDI